MSLYRDPHHFAPTQPKINNREIVLDDSWRILYYVFG